MTLFLQNLKKPWSLDKDIKQLQSVSPWVQHPGLSGNLSVTHCKYCSRPKRTNSPAPLLSTRFLKKKKLKIIVHDDESSSRTKTVPSWTTKASASSLGLRCWNDALPAVQWMYRLTVEASNMQMCLWELPSSPISSAQTGKRSSVIL